MTGDDTFGLDIDAAVRFEGTGTMTADQRAIKIIEALAAVAFAAMRRDHPEICPPLAVKP